MKHVQPGDIRQDVVLLDVRDELEAAGRPLEAISDGRSVVRLPLADLEEGATPDLPAGAQVVVVCGNGSRSDLAAAYLESAGMRDVAVLEGGARAWRRALDGQPADVVDPLETA